MYYFAWKNWRDTLGKINNSIVFIDEQSHFITTKEFAVAIQGTDNYYVLITHRDVGIEHDIMELVSGNVSGTYIWECREA